MHTDDSIIMGPNQQERDAIIPKMENTGITMTYDDVVAIFVRVNIDQKEDGTIPPGATTLDQVDFGGPSPKWPLDSNQTNPCTHYHPT